MRKRNLILITLTIVFSLLVIITSETNAESINPFGNYFSPGVQDDLINSHRQNRSMSADPASTTTLVKKDTTRNTLESWFPFYFAKTSVLGKPTVKLNGFNALPFQGNLDGVPQRGIAIDLGDFFLIESSTDLNITEAELLGNAQATYDQSLKSRRSRLNAMSGCECTDYAHEKVPTLPYGLFSYNDKVSKINHLFPQGDGGTMSSVAVHNIGSVGHVSVVTGVAIRSDGNLNVSLTEKNLHLDCQITTRTTTMEQASIVGYFDPHYTAGDSFPNLTGASNTVGSAGVPFTVNLSGSSFDPGSMSAIILGGTYCTTFYSCQIPNSSLINKTGSSVSVPLQLNSAGPYRLYIFNANQGKTSFGQTITVN